MDEHPGGLPGVRPAPGTRCARFWPTQRRRATGGRLRPGVLSWSPCTGVIDQILGRRPQGVPGSSATQPSGSSGDSGRAWARALLLDSGGRPRGSTRIRVESVLPCLRARPGGLLEREDVRAVEMQSQDGGGSGWIARKRPRSVPAHPCVRAAQAYSTCSGSAAMTPAATSQARGVSHNQKTIKSRRKEKHRRRTNSLSLRRGG